MNTATNVTGMYLSMNLLYLYVLLHQIIDFEKMSLIKMDILQQNKRKIAY